MCETCKGKRLFVKVTEGQIENKDITWCPDCVGKLVFADRDLSRFPNDCDQSYLWRVGGMTAEEAVQRTGRVVEILD